MKKCIKVISLIFGICLVGLTAFCAWLYITDTTDAYEDLDC